METTEIRKSVTQMQFSFSLFCDVDFTYTTKIVERLHFTFIDQELKSFSICFINLFENETFPLFVYV